MEPRVSKRERKLHLSYDLPHRIHCCRIYPLPAPNGASVILYGHDGGLRVLWRGGRRLKDPLSTQAAPQTNGVGKSQDVMLLDSEQDGDEELESGDGYANEDDELDPGCPYPDIDQHVDVDLRADVLHIACPAFSSQHSSQRPTLAKSRMIVAVACADAKVVLLTIPLAPPRDESDFDSAVTDLQIQAGSTIAQDLAVQWIPGKAEDKLLDDHIESSEGRLLVATSGRSLGIWNLAVTTNGISTTTASPILTTRTQLLGSMVSFHPSASSSLLLLADRAGFIRIYSTTMSKTSDPRPSSRGSSSSVPTKETAGALIMTYHTPFQTQKDSPALARRKRVLDAAWILNGRGILVLLEDGEWGIWDISGQTQAGKNVEDFALRGYLGSSTAAETPETGKPAKSASKLVPMTPTTRTVKAERLFSGPARPIGVAANGGISTSATTTRSGQMDESIIIWYDNELYSIPNTQAFWQRSSTSPGSFGSLYAPGLTHLSDINPLNETITSISQFTSKSSPSALGSINGQKDLLVSAEHRFFILQSLNPLMPGRDVAQRAAERPVSRDQHMLDAGELDLGGMARLLDSMAEPTRNRRVGFAH